MDFKDFTTGQAELVDTHCHLQFKDLAENIDSVLDRASRAGVGRMICVGTNLQDSQIAVDTAAKYPNVWAAVGAHPHDGSDFAQTKDATQMLNKLSKSPRVVAVGEIGLDYYHEHTDRALQTKMLKAQIEATLEAGLPYIFHVRDAFSAFWTIVDDYPIKKAVVHSFTAGTKTLNKILERGWYVGLNGIMTFTRDQAQLDAAKAVPRDRLLVETDAPFLAPAPERAKVCEPKHVKVTAEFLADLRGESLEELATITTANAIKLFNLSK